MNNNNIGDILTLNALRHPGKIAVIDYPGERLSYAALNRRVNRLANALKGLGLKKGDKIAYLFFNNPRFLEAHFAVAKIGAVGVPLNFRLVGRELAYQLNDSDTVCVIYSSEFATVIDSIKEEVKQVRHFICDGGCAESATHYASLTQGQSEDEPGDEVSLYDEHLILYTSGTTGLPKGSVLIHKNALFNGLNMIMGLNLTHNEIIQVIPPLFHSASLNGITVPSILMGSTMVLHSQFKPDEALKAIQEEKITFTWGPSTLLRGLISFQEFDKYDVSSVRLIVNGAMYMPAQMRSDVLEHFPSAQISDIYGMTEASPATTILPSDRALEKTSSLGLPFPLCDVKIFDNEGEELPPGEVGEIVTRGNFMKCYYKKEDQTAKTIRNGWLWSGDLGMKDEEGFIYLVDRKKDMINSGGENVYSKEVEEVISGHPKVFEVAVIGLPDEKWGETVAAIVTPFPGEEIAEDELMLYCRENLAGYKCPRILKFKEELPKNPSGKILKRLIKEEFDATGQ